MIVKYFIKYIIEMFLFDNIYYRSILIQILTVVSYEINYLINKLGLMILFSKKKLKYNLQNKLS